MNLDTTPWLPGTEAVLERALHLHGNGHHGAHESHDHHAFLHRPVSVLERVGDTPLLRVQQLAQAWNISPRVQVYAKAEWFNPGGSVKDRAALRIVREAQRRGQLTPDKSLIDSTSGNTGIAYAWIGATLGFRVVLVMPENVSEERKQTLRAYGAELVFSSPFEGSDGAIERVRQMVAAAPERYFYANQYDNPANWQAHFLSTGPELWAQTQGKVSHFVAGLGTTGTLMGTGRFLKQMNPQVQLVAVEPEDELSVIEGLKFLDSAIMPGIYCPELIDERLYVSPSDAFDSAKALAQREGWFVGFSAGAAMVAALRLAQRLDEGTIVTLLPDSGAKYVSLMRDA